METTRSEKLLKSSAWSISGYVLYTIIGFVSRSVFINRLGENLTGTATLFANVLSLLSVAELVFSNAMAIQLYKPVAVQDEREISALINYYGKAYRRIALCVFGAGLFMTPFIHLFITSDQKIEHLEFYFLLYMIQTTMNYMFNYKAPLFSLYQEFHLGERIRYFFLILVTLLQAVSLYFIGSYTVYLLIRITGTLLTNITRTLLAEKRYPYLKKYKNEDISPEVKNDIASYVKSMIIDKSALTLKATTGVILTSKLISVATTAIISNYDLVITASNAVLGIFFTNAVAGIGNMAVTEDKQSQFSTYLDLSFVSFWIYGFVCTGIACVASPFVMVWLGSARYTISLSTLILLVTNMFIVGISFPSENYFTALGLVKHIRYRSLINLVLNIVLSVLLSFQLGVNGIYLGVIIGFAISTFWITPYTVFKHYFGFEKIDEFLMLSGRGIAANAVCLAASLYICGFFAIGGIAEVIVKGIVCTVVYNLLFVAMFFTSKQFKNMFRLVMNILKNIMKRQKC